MFVLLWLGAPAYAGIGVLVWLAVYWSAGVVPIIYTMAIPVGGFLLLGVEPSKVLASLLHPALLLILTPALVVLAASSCGLLERVSVVLVRIVGPSFRGQIIFWLVFSTVVSCFAANVVVAIALTPIVLALLAQAGLRKPADITGSKSALTLIIAVAVGASLGGILTPMAGGQAAITWAALNQALGGEVTAASFTTRMLLPVAGSLLITVFIFLALPLDQRVLRLMSPVPRSWTAREVAVAALLVVALVLPYARPWLPVSLVWLYGGLALVMLLLPVPRVGLLLPPRALLQFPLNALSLWPIAMSASVLVGETAAGPQLSALMGQYFDGGSWWTVGALVLFCVVLAQVASDTGAAGIIAPVLLALLLPLGENPVPWLLTMGFSVNLSFMVPTATGTLAVPYALGGRNHWRLPVYGLAVSISCGLFSWLFWGLVFRTEFWSTLDVLR